MRYITYEDKETEEGITKFFMNQAKDRAINGEFHSYTKELEFREEIYELDEEGNVIRSAEFDDYWKAENMMEEWMKEIYEKGLEETHSVVWVKSKIDEGSYYIPELMNKWREESISKRIDFLHENQRRIKEQNERSDRWREGCEWAKSKGARIRLEMGVRRKTLVKNIIRLNLVDEWNEKYPEFKITDRDMAVTE